MSVTLRKSTRYFHKYEFSNHLGSPTTSHYLIMRMYIRALGAVRTVTHGRALGPGLQAYCARGLLLITKIIRINMISFYELLDNFFCILSAPYESRQLGVHTLEAAGLRLVRLHPTRHFEHG